MTEEVHSEMAQALVRACITITTRARITTPEQRRASVIVLEAGRRPRVLPRAELARRLRAAGMIENALHVARRPTKPHEVLCFIISDECTGEIAIPVAQAPKGVPLTNIALPTDEVIAGLLGEVSP